MQQQLQQAGQRMHVVGQRAGGAPGAGGRRLAQGVASCHPTALYAKHVAAAYLDHPKTTTVYVASGSLTHLAAFAGSAITIRMCQVGHPSTLLRC